MIPSSASHLDTSEESKKFSNDFLRVFLDVTLSAIGPNRNVTSFPHILQCAIKQAVAVGQ